MASNTDANKVGFEDVEIGKSGCDSFNGSNSKEMSILGPLPSEMKEGAPERRYSGNSSNASVNSYEKGSAAGMAKKFGLPGGSILKKRNTSSKGGGKSVTSGVTGKTGSVRTSSTGGTNLTAQFHLHKGTPRNVWYSRWLFLTLLCMVASALGYLTYAALSRNETYLAECVYSKVAEHAIDAISTNQKNKKLGLDSIASVIGKFPFVLSFDYSSSCVCV